MVFGEVSHSNEKSLIYRRLVAFRHVLQVPSENSTAQNWHKAHKTTCTNRRYSAPYHVALDRAHNQHLTMADSDLSALITSKSEALEVEYKSWTDTSEAVVGAQLARHLAALSNHGGGYVIFGVDDATKLPQGATALDPKLFGEDAISAIVKRYLDPRFQCRIEWAEVEGVAYPVLIVPSHGARPVIAIADGPQDQKGRPIGIREGALYIRAAGPESIAIRRPDDWTAILERCLRHRADILASIMRQAMGSSSKPSLSAIELLKVACAATAASFAAQVDELVPLVDAQNQARVREAGSNFAVLGYALIGEDGELLRLDDLRAANARADVGMHQYAYAGWNMFLPLHVPERAPQMRSDTLLGEERLYLEGMRLPNTGVLSAALDYWRMYEDGICCFAESYRDDYAGRSERLGISLTLMKLHSILAHARLVGQEMPAIAKVILHMEWKGLAQRYMMWDRDMIASSQRIADDRFARTITLDWAEIRDDYFLALRKISLPFFNLVPVNGSTDSGSWFTRDRIRQMFDDFHQRFRLFD